MVKKLRNRAAQDATLINTRAIKGWIIKLDQKYAKREREFDKRLKLLEKELKETKVRRKMLDPFQGWR